MSADRDKKWEQVQIKAFKSWVNSALASKNIDPVDNIQTDFADGVKLIRFLEIVTGKAIGKKYDLKPVQKIQKIQNLHLALTFIAENLNVKLVGVGAEDIFDGNLKLVLGMLWTLFRTLRIQSIKDEGHTSEDALLHWVKKMTADYDGVNVTDFKTSFADGLAFSALIHKFNDELLDYSKLQKVDAENNLENAFSIAEKGLGIPKLLDAADLLNGNPDERSVILYVSLFFHAFVANEETLNQRAKTDQVLKKVTELESQLDMMMEEKEEVERKRRSLQTRVDELIKEGEEKDRLLTEANEKIKLLQEELDYMRQRALNDAETIALLEEKNRILSELLDRDSASKGQVEEARARLLAELEELRNRSRELIGENENLDDMRRRLITENDKREGILKDLEMRRNALQNEIDQLRKLVNAEIEKRKAAVRTALQLKKELEDLKNKQVSQGKARVALDILRRNLEEHLEDMYRWRELHGFEDDQSRIFNLDQVLEDLKDKSFHQQLEYLDDQLSAENKSLLRIIRLKDSQFKLKETELKSGWLFMKGRKDWKKRWFSLRGFTLFYFENETSQRCEGFVDLNKGCEVVRQKAVKEDDSAKKQWPLKITVGDRKLFVRAATKKERHSWYLFLASKIAHLNYLKAVETSNNRPDTRLITLFTSETVTDLHLDHRALPEEGAAALARTLIAHDETERLSLINTQLNDLGLKALAEHFEKYGLKSIDLSSNKVTSASMEDLGKGIAANQTLTEISLENNEIDDAGVVALLANIGLKPTLNKINLNGNKISAGGAAAFAEHLSSPEHSLPELQLARNQLDDAACDSLAQLLSSNPTIIHVDLSGNKIGNRGVASLVQALTSPNCAVATLDLSNNEIGIDGALAISNLLNVNKSILSVNLSNNKHILGTSSLATLFKEGFNFPNLSFHRVV